MAKVLEFQHLSFLWIFRINSFRIHWFDVVIVQGTLKSLLQHHSSKASILWHLVFFMVQPSHPYMTTGKTIVLTRQTFVGKILSLLFNMLSRLVIAWLPRGKCLLILWLQSSATMVLEPKICWFGSLSFLICKMKLFCKDISPLWNSLRGWQVLYRLSLRNIIKCLDLNTQDDKINKLYQSALN